MRVDRYVSYSPNYHLTFDKQLVDGFLKITHTTGREGVDRGEGGSVPT